MSVRHDYCCPPGLPLGLVYRRLSIFPVSSTCLLPFVSLETRRIPASSSFISSRLSSLKLTSPKLDLSSFSRSMSVIEPFFSRTSTMNRDIGLGLHILFNAWVTGRDSIRGGLGHGDRGSFLLEPLAEALVPVLHVGSHRRFDAVKGIPEVLYRDTLRFDVPPQGDKARFPTNSF